MRDSPYSFKICKRNKSKNLTRFDALEIRFIIFNYFQLKWRICFFVYSFALQRISTLPKSSNETFKYAFRTPISLSIKLI